MIENKNPVADSGSFDSVYKSAREWLGTTKRPEFWSAAKRLDVLLQLSVDNQEQRAQIVREFINATKLAQLDAFHLGLQRGEERAKKEAAKLRGRGRPPKYPRPNVERPEDKRPKPETRPEQRANM